MSYEELKITVKLPNSYKDLHIYFFILISECIFVLKTIVEPEIQFNIYYSVNT